jgi:predicted acylesterase/phospholipase RssA
MESLNMKNYIKALPCVILLASQAFAQSPVESPSPAPKKPFHRALILSGGGDAPAISLGVIQALSDAGWNPDVIITTCGSSISSSLLMYKGDVKSAMEYIESEEGHSALAQLKVRTKNALTLIKVFAGLRNPDVDLDLFDHTIAEFPETGQGLFGDTAFTTKATGPRFVMVASRANFSMGDDLSAKKESRFTETYFTDADTAQYLTGFISPMSQFPGSFVSPETNVITNRTAGEAMRASISDPFLINPARLGDDYYLTGAIDIVPVALAHQLADEVIATKPGTFKSYENLAIERTFGYKQDDSVAKAVSDPNVTFIQSENRNKVSFDPSNFLIWFHTNLPKNLKKYVRKLEAQFNMGRDEVQANGSFNPTPHATPNEAQVND